MSTIAKQQGDQADQTVLELRDHRGGRERAACSQMPPCTAATKVMTQVPTVTASVRIAAVEG